jgi:hypothetical protein
MRDQFFNSSFVLPKYSRIWRLRNSTSPSAGWLLRLLACWRQNAVLPVIAPLQQGWSTACSEAVAMTDHERPQRGLRIICRDASSFKQASLQLPGSSVPLSTLSPMRPLSSDLSTRRPVSGNFTESPFIVPNPLKMVGRARLLIRRIHGIQPTALLQGHPRGVELAVPNVERIGVNLLSRPAGGPPGSQGPRSQGQPPPGPIWPGLIPKGLWTMAHLGHAENGVFPKH